MNSTVMHLLIDAVLDGEISGVVIEVKKLLNAKVKPERIIKDRIVKVMVELDHKCTVEHFNLLEIMLAGRVIMAIVNELYPIGIPSSQANGTIIIAQKLLPKTCLDGNIKSLCFIEATPAEIASKSKKLLDSFANRGGYILSSGCEIPPESNPENILAMVMATK